MKKWDVVIIGSGISSLTCGAILAKKGKSVLILEQHTVPGGYLHCFRRFGIRFDTGSHYIGAMEPGQPFRTILEYLGVYREDHYVPLDPSGYDVFAFPSFRVEIPKGYEAVVEQISRVFPSERKAIGTYYKLVRENSEKFPTYNFIDEFDEIEVLKSMETPLSKVVEGLTKDPRLMCVFYSYCAIHGVDPRHISIGLHSLATDSMLRGPYGFRKGGEAVTQSYVDAIKSWGGEVRLRSRVSKLLTKDKSVYGVELASGERIEAERVISGIHPKTTFRLVDSSLLKPAFRSRLDRIKETLAVFGIYAVSDVAPDLNPLKNYYFCNTEDPYSFLETGGPEDSPVGVFITRPGREAGAIKGKYPLTFHSASPYSWFEKWKDTPYSRRPSEYYQLKEKVAGSVFKLTEKFCPGLSASITEYDTSSPLTNLHFNGSEEGSAYGLYHSIENTGMRALGPATHFNNLLLTGQNTLTPGLLGAAISGLRTAGYVVGLKPLIRELRAFLGVEL